MRGFTVGVTADRRADEQAVMLRRLGVDVVQGAALQTVFVPAEGSELRAQVAGLIAEPPDYLVANTGIGVRTLFANAEEWGVADDLRRALGGARILARGPKVAGALRLAGLEVWWRAPGERLAEVTERLLELGVGGSRVVFQRHGDDREGLTTALGAAGAEVTELEVYRWAPPAEPSAAMALIEACCRGEVDAVTFTAAPAIRRLFDVAEAAGRAEALTEVLDREMVVACVGPVCAAAAVEEGLTSPVVPEHWRLGSLVKLVGEALVDRRRVLAVEVAGGTVEVVLQGRLLVVGGREATLAPEERALARLLAENPAEAVSEDTLAERIWRSDAPPAAGRVEALGAVVSRLQDTLGPAGASVTSPAPGALRWKARRLAPATVPAELP